MKVSAENELHLRIPAHDLGESLAPGQADPVHVIDTGDEGGMVHQHQIRNDSLKILVLD